MSRLGAIVGDARPAAILTVSSLLPDAERWTADIPELRGLPCLATNVDDGSRADRAFDFTPTPDSLAFLQYTSGSTSKPRGVI